MDSRLDYPDGGGDLTTKNHPRVAAFFASLDRMLDGLERMVVACKPALGGERFLTDREASERLKISRRTLQEWRYGGTMPYLQLGGKILFRESDIQSILDRGLRNVS